MLKVALIGCGFAGSTHARRAQELGLDVAVLCDVNEDSARRLRDDLGSGEVITDSAQVMRDDSIDLVIVATLHDAHHPLAMAAAQAGKHILVEKPMCMTRGQAIEVAEAVEMAGVKLNVNCKFRAAATTQKVKELIPHPTISHGQLAMENSGGLNLWRPDVGGGLLVATAIHTIDLISYLMDSPPDRVYAEGRLFDKSKDTAGFYDGVVGTILWKNGGLSTMISTDQGHIPSVSKWFHEVWDGERSAVLSDHTNRVDFGGCDIDYVDVKEFPEDQQRHVFLFSAMLKDLVEAIQTGGDTLCNAQDGVTSVSICNALDEAARTGRPQTVAA